MGERIAFASNGDSRTGYLAAPAAGNGPGVIIMREWWGLVPHIEAAGGTVEAFDYPGTRHAFFNDHRP